MENEKIEKKEKNEKNEKEKGGQSHGKRRRPFRRHGKGKPANAAPHRETPVIPEPEEASPIEYPAMLREEEPIPTKAAEERIPAVGIRFRPAGKNYSFDPGELTLAVGDTVIVETVQGTEFGTVSTACRLVSSKDLVLPLKKVLRRTTEKDLLQYEDNKELELRARKVFLEKTVEFQLDMALSDVECSFDRSKLIFYFTSEGRVDFREFVKAMASIFKTRIELRQIGVRDEAKQLGGLGICGRPLCCSSFLEDFQQVSIKMAKEQGLSLNPTKISGSCGRLMCCLRYENDVYVEAAKSCPRADQAVMTPQGKGVVTEANILCGRCKVRLDSDPDNIFNFTAEELKPLPKQKKNHSQDNNTEKE